MRKQDKKISKIISLVTKLVIVIIIVFALSIWIKNTPEQVQSTVSKAFSEPPYNFKIPTYDKTFETKKLRINIDTKTMNFTVVNKNGEFAWKSALGEEDEDINNTWRMFFNSAVTVEFYNEVGGIRRLYSSRDAEIKLTKQSQNQLIFNVKFLSAGISFELVFSIFDDSVDVMITNIKESTYKLMGLFIYPYLGGSKGITNGRFILADGAGAVIDLSKTSTATAPFKMRMYGEDLGFKEVLPFTYFRNIKEPESYTLPMYGIIYENNGLLTIIKDTEEYVEINAYRSGIVTPYNWLAGRFVFRDTYKKLLNKQGQGITIPQEKMNSVKPHLRYYFLQNANEFTLANKFIDEYKSQISQKKQSTPIFKIDVLMSEAKETAFGYTTIKMTTQEQLGLIKQELSKSIDNVLYVLRGYSKGGYSRNSPYHLPFERKVISDFEKLKNDYVYVDYVEFPKESKHAKKLIIAQNKLEQFMEKEGNFLTNPTILSNIANDEKHKFSELKIDNIAIGDIGNILYSTKTLERSESKKIFETTVREFKTPLIYGVNWYLIKSAGMIADVPLENSAYEIEDDVFPLLPFVLTYFRTVFSKPINLSADYKLQLLKCLEYAVMPSFYLTWESSKELVDTNSQDLISTRFKDWNNQIEESYRTFKEFYKIIGETRPINRQKIYDNVYVIDYENGLSVIFNYNHYPITYENQTVQEVSYKVLKR